MKKLIFSALLATVAFGSSYAYRFTPTAGPSEFGCNGLENPLCSTVAGGVYTNDGFATSDPSVLSQTLQFEP